MGIVRLIVNATQSAGVQDSWIKIDAQDVVITNGTGHADVEETDFQQTYTYWFMGNSGSQFAFEIKESNATLKKVTDTIAVGYNREWGGGQFKLLSPTGLW